MEVCIGRSCYTHWGAMRTNIDIDDDLLTEAITASGLSTKKATVEEALRVSCNGTAGGQRWST